jgi:sigma-B regulation protein RsbU (phosphoserine phosphatase)
LRLLLAEDDAVTRQTLRAMLMAQGHEVTDAEDGSVAWGAWQLSQPRIVISDWLMPEMDGLELCRKIRALPGKPYTYFILQTSRTGRENFLEAMGAGVDDFVTKPVAADELKARLGVAERILGLRQELLALEGLLSVCSYCKRIRHADGGWGSLERYIEQRSKAEFSHGLCDDCYEKHLKPHIR